jgi:DNA-binding NtrC family response regulator
MATKTDTTTVLVVDDDSQLRTLTKLILGKSGYNVLTAPCAEEAIRLIEQNPASIGMVVSDIHMGGMSGLDLHKHLRGICPQIPVLLVSGAYQGDCHDFAFLPKPYSFKDLLGKVETMTRMAIAA